MTGKRLSINDRNAPLDGDNQLKQAKRFIDGVKKRAISEFARDR